jgi:hypothetical protein
MLIHCAAPNIVLLGHLRLQKAQERERFHAGGSSFFSTMKVFFTSHTLPTIRCDFKLGRIALLEHEPLPFKWVKGQEELCPDVVVDGQEEGLSSSCATELVAGGVNGKHWPSSGRCSA